MNKFYKTLASAFFLVLSLNTCYSGIAPTFNMTVKNIQCISGPTSDSIVQFEVYLQQTNFGQPGVDEFEYAGGQFTFLCNRAVQNGNLVLSLNNSLSSLPPALRPPTFQVDSLTAPPGQLYLKGSGNLPQSGVNYFISPTFPGTRIVTFRLRTSANHFPLVPFNLKFKLGPAPNTFLAYFLPFGSQDSNENPNQTAVALMDTVANVYSVENSGYLYFCNGGGLTFPVANFYSNTRVISVGGSVNFIDSSLNVPTSWSWTFPGGTPGTSTLSNPTGIVYNTPGTYSVTLNVTNAAGSNQITKTNYITVNPSTCVTTWKNTIKITDAGNIKDSLILGTSPSGTNGIDPCLGELSLPPAPMTGSYDIRFLLSNDASKTDIRKDSAGDKVWTLQFQPGPSGYPMTFTWNINSFPQNEFFYLRDIINGSLVNINMLNQSSYTLTSAITPLKIEYYNKINKSISLNSGWNILSVPLLKPDMKVTSVFPTAASLAYSYNNGYVSADSLKNGKGYWIKFNSDTNYNILGINVTPKNINVVSGWNLIGPFEENIPVSSITSVPSGIISSSYFGFSNMYFTTDTLKQGKGYWIRTSASGILMKNLADDPKGITTVNSDSLNLFTKITFTDADNQSSELLLANSNQITQNYDMPPVPPEGIFDVRFGSDKSVESFGKSHNLKLNSAHLPLKIRVSNSKNHRLRLNDAVTGNLINVVLEEGVDYELNQNFENLTLSDEGIIPDNYSLAQNYPNPFNPSTTIKYNVPVDGSVRIVIYDLTGKEIQTLVNRFVKAGSYEIKFNGINLSSGIYIYKMQSGEFSEIKRMVLIK